MNPSGQFHLLTNAEIRNWLSLTGNATYRDSMVAVSIWRVRLTLGTLESLGSVCQRQCMSPATYPSPCLRLLPVTVCILSTTCEKLSADSHASLLAPSWLAPSCRGALFLSIPRAAPACSPVRSGSLHQSRKPHRCGGRSCHRQTRAIRSWPWKG